MRYPYWQMVDNSANDLHSTGSMIGCERLKEEFYNAGLNKTETINHSNFLILRFYISTVSSYLQLGICVPRSCTQPVLDRIQMNSQGLIQPICKKFLINHFKNDPLLNIKSLIEPSCSFEVNIQETEEYYQRKDSYDNVINYVFVPFGFYLVFVAIISIIDCFGWLQFFNMSSNYHRTKNKQRQNYYFTFKKLEDRIRKRKSILKKEQLQNQKVRLGKSMVNIQELNELIHGKNTMPRKLSFL